jgi:hypothetical protein
LSLPWIQDFLIMWYDLERRPLTLKNNSILLIQVIQCTKSWSWSLWFGLYPAYHGFNNK